MSQLTHNPISARRLDAYRVGLQLVSTISPWLARIARHDKDLAGQLKRALPSGPQNLSEALRRVGGDRAHLLTVALGSVDEVRTIIDIAHVHHILTAHEVDTAEQLADRFAAMLYRIRQRFA